MVNQGKEFYKHRIRPGAYDTMGKILKDGTATASTLKDNALCCITDVHPMEYGLTPVAIKQHENDRLFQVILLGEKTGTESLILQSLLEDLPADQWQIIES